MSQWARNNPELYEQGVDWLDAHSDLADREKQREKVNQFWKDGKACCPYCGVGLDEEHKPGCRLFVAED